MNINPISALDTDNLRSRHKQPLFKSVIPVRVLVGGVAADRKTTESVLRKLMSILHEEGSNDIARGIQDLFFRHETTVRRPGGKGIKGAIFRQRHFGSEHFLFTGKQAAILEEIGRQIGIAGKRPGDKLKWQEAYSAQIKKMVDETALRLLGRDRSPLTLVVNATKVKGRTPTVKDIRFEQPTQALSSITRPQALKKMARPGTWRNPFRAVETEGGDITSLADFASMMGLVPQRMGEVPRRSFSHSGTQLSLPFLVKQPA